MQLLRMRSIHFVACHVNLRWMALCARAQPIADGAIISPTMRTEYARVSDSVASGNKQFI